MTGITNEEGQVYQSYRYSASGEITFGAPQYENEYTYNGESYNPNIESQYLRARYYDVTTVAFLTEDSYPQDMWRLWDITEPLTLNRYNYCAGNPVNYADKSGHWVENDIAKAILDDPSISKEDKGREINKRIQFYFELVRGGNVNANYEYVMGYNFGNKKLDEVIEEAKELNYVVLCDKVAVVENSITERDVIVEENQKPVDAMFKRDTVEILARMIYQETKEYKNGEQSKVLWVVVNRIFTEENFTNGKAKTIETVLREGGFESITHNYESQPYNAFHPDYESSSWENAKRLAASLYAVVGDRADCQLTEERVRERLASLQDINGNYITNEIGLKDSFWGDGRENHFYTYKEGRSSE